jgi:hypothetical protein
MPQAYLKVKCKAKLYRYSKTPEARAISGRSQQLIIMTQRTNIDFKILNQLKNGRTADGKVGAKVKPTGDNPNNKAWITVVMKKGVDCKDEITRYYFLNYEIEYLELDEEYDEEIHGYDWDLFLVRTEICHNIKDELELERILGKWLNNVNELKPASNIEHPNL